MAVDSPGFHTVRGLSGDSQGIVRGLSGDCQVDKTRSVSPDILLSVRASVHTCVGHDAGRERREGFISPSSIFLCFHLIPALCAVNMISLLGTHRSSGCISVTQYYTVLPLIIP